ncbi:MAG: outer membrane lipoprotein carrier protein LolA [Magnetospirillum sp.]|nr:outer membrane lipoprotein carrier protein LolA [Magnetospirillum sp.]
MSNTRSKMRAAGLAVLLAALVPAAIALPAAPASAAHAVRAQLTPEDRSDVLAAQTYLNGITSLKARFLQISSNGSQAEGMAYLSRPGKLRLQYDPPSPLLVVADGTFLIVEDKTLDNPSYIPLNSTPAGVLVRANVELDGKDLAVTKVSHQPGILGITVVDADDPGQGQLTLIFSQRPFQLRQWQVIDAEGQITTVSLFDAETGIPLDPSLFVYKNPAFGRPKL